MVSDESFGLCTYVYTSRVIFKKNTLVFALRDFTTPVQKLLKEFKKKLYMVNIFFAIKTYDHECSSNRNL